MVRNVASSKALVGRKSVSSEKLPVTEEKSAEDAAATRGLRKNGNVKLSLYRGAIAVLALVVVILALATKRRHLSSVSAYVIVPAAEPCHVAGYTAERLERLKMQGRSKEHDSFPRDWEPELPKIIHHQWKDENIPEMYKEWHQKWYDLFPEPEYTHMLWTDDSARALIKDHYPWFLETYDDYDYPIKRADAVRYFYLYHYGGVHTDLDYEPMSNFFKHLPTDRVGLVESPYKFNEEAQNSLMSSPKGDPFWHNVFTQLILNKDNGVLSATGPRMIDMAFESSRHPVHFLPCENFQRIPFSESEPSHRGRDFYGRYYPMKQCGNYDDSSCHFAKHHNTASYAKGLSPNELS